MTSMNIQRDVCVYAEDSEVGRVTHVVLDPESREVTELIVGRNGSEWRIPIADVASAEGGRVTLHGGQGAFTRGERFSRDGFRPVDGEQARDESAHQTLHGGAPLLDASKDAVEAGGLPHTPVATAYTAGGEDGSDSLQLREELLTVSVEPQQAGIVRLTRSVTERVETIEVPVREERLVIDLAPGSGGRIMVGDRELHEGESIEILLNEERVIVNKELVVREEVALRTEVFERTEVVQETLRREELVVDDAGGLVAGGGTVTAGPGDGSAAPRTTAHLH